MARAAATETAVPEIMTGTIDRAASSTIYRNPTFCDES
jgi:hypothetical protein